eukprot:1776928-Prymnesium_polylepis.2
MMPLCDHSMNDQDQAVITNFSEAFVLVPSSLGGWAVAFNWDRCLSLRYLLDPQLTQSGIAH